MGVWGHEGYCCPVDTAIASIQFSMSSHVTHQVCHMPSKEQLQGLGLGPSYSDAVILSIPLSPVALLPM